MTRNLDLVALRSFVAVADAGGVTKAAGFLHLTQSAVSMQLKRLEDSLDLRLFDRSNRRIALTTAGEQLLSYARRLLALNDEVYARLTHQEFEGEITLGVPHDIVYPAIPMVLRKFHAEYPRMRVNLVSSYTRKLKWQFDHGDIDMIMTTEDGCDTGGETLVEKSLIWVGAPNGSAWKARPLRLAFERNCIFRSSVQNQLDAAGIPWEMAVEADATRAIEATVAADLAVHALIDGTLPPFLEPIPHGCTLPDLPSKKLNLYVADPAREGVSGELAQLVRQAYEVF